jgi:hypothetical protein
MNRKGKDMAADPAKEQEHLEEAERLAQLPREVQKQAIATIRAPAVKVKQDKAREAYADLVPTMNACKAEGLSLREIAAQLNAEGHTTRRGRPWNPVQVARVLAGA